MINQQHTLNRLDYFDAVRCFALVLGIVFHGALSFMPVFIGWAVMDVSTSPSVSVFALVSHSFRMALFFLIAGYVSRTALIHKGVKGFITSRVIRIGIPFVIGWLVLKPLLVLAWVIGGQSLRGDIDFNLGLAHSLSVFSDLPVGLLVGSHLWFLYYLLLISFCAVALKLALAQHHGAYLAATRATDTLMQWISRSYLGRVAVLAITVLCLNQMQNWGIDTPDKSLFPHFPALFLYAGFYGVGYQLHRQPNISRVFTQTSPSRWVLCIFCILSTIGLANYEMQTGHADYSWLKLAFQCSYGAMMWLLVSLTLGMFQHLFKQSNPLVRYLSDSSYWLYIIHLPIIIGLQITVAELPLHWLIKWPAICMVTMALSLVLYDLLVRPTIIGQVLNNKRRPSVIVQSVKNTF